MWKRKHKGIQDEDVVGGLADVLAALGDELRDANRRAKKREGGPVVALGYAEVHIEVAVEKAGGAGFDFKVLKADGRVNRTRTAKVVVNLNAFDGDDGVPFAMGQ